MTDQPRDSKGRFSSNGKKRIYTSYEVAEREYNLSLICLLLVTACVCIGFWWGVYYEHPIAKAEGYSAGVADNQPVVFKDGFNNGVGYQKRYDNFVSNWTACNWWWGYGDTPYCNKMNKSIVRYFDKNYEMVWGYDADPSGWIYNMEFYNEWGCLY